jgi:hypothetical protein
MEEIDLDDYDPIERERHERYRQHRLWGRYREWSFLASRFLIALSAMALMGIYVYKQGTQAFTIFAFSMIVVAVMGVIYEVSRTAQRLENHMSDLWVQLNEIRKMLNRRKGVQEQP